jgi:Plasmid pRiA4b ORF-3-like protein
MSPAENGSAFDSFNEIATVRIELRDSNPVIWRQVEVPTSITLKVLHNVIQAAMGWFDYHLWEFTVGERRYGLPTDEDWGTEPRIDAGKVRLREVLRPRRTTIDYLYDFGDSWEHRLTLTHIRAGEPDLSYPATSPASITPRRRIAAASPAFTRCSTTTPIPTIRTMPKPRSGSTIASSIPSTSCPSNTPSAASRTSATPPRPASRRKSHPPTPAD